MLHGRLRGAVADQWRRPCLATWRVSTSQSPFRRYPRSDEREALHSRRTERRAGPGQEAVRVSAVSMGRSDSGPRSSVDHRRMTPYVRTVSLALALCLLFACASRPPKPRSRVASSRRSPPSGAQLYYGDRGWEYLKTRLVADGVARDTVARAFDDPRMPAFDAFSSVPGAARIALHVPQLPAGSGTQGESCRGDHAAALERRASLRRSGGRGAAIITSRPTAAATRATRWILYRLARLAMAEEPHNLARNLRAVQHRQDPASRHGSAQRARYLERDLLPAGRATFEIARRRASIRSRIRGSGAGAFGSATCSSCR